MDNRILSQAQRTIAARKAAAEEACERTLEKLNGYADWKNCLHDLKSAQVKWALYGDEQARNAAEKLQKQRALLLKKYRLTEKDVTPQYSCPICCDTGYVDGVQCQCLKKELRRLLAGQSNVTNVNYTFGNSAETDERNLAIAKKAQKVCRGDALKNILLTGKTGNGKTYLLTSCANLCTELGKSVLFVTAYSLGSLFMEAYLSDLASQKAIMDNLTEVDVLAIDDLGTESVYKNVTGQYMFSLINERISRGKQTFYSTNLTLQQLRDTYDERIFSRLVDRNNTFVAQLSDGDKRILTR